MNRNRIEEISFVNYAYKWLTRKLNSVQNFLIVNQSSVVPLGFSVLQFPMMLQKAHQKWFMARSEIDWPLEIKPAR